MAEPVPPPAVRFEDATARIGDRAVWSHVDLSITAGDFVAVLDRGAPATLTLSIAAPAPVRVAATLAAVRARLAEDPIVGAALRAGALRVEAAFADAVALSSPAKRRLTIREATPCAQRC